MMKSKNNILGIDIGGTSIKSSIVDIENGRLIADIIKVKTPKPASVDAILEIVNKLKDDFNWEGSVGCGFPGVVKNDTIVTATNLSKEWIGINLEDQLKSTFSGEIAVINDADAAAIAEMRFGSGQKWNAHNRGVVLIVTLGTGIGSALFVDGHLVPNTEFGHIIMNGVKAEKLAATIVKENEDLSWEEWGTRVNQYLNIMHNLLSPDCIIIGGGVSSSPEKFFKYIDIETELLPAKMGNDAGIIGAALALRS